MMQKIDMKTILQSKKIRVTDFRLAVLGIFNNHENAISTDQIESELKDFDRITLYRTLKIFKEKGVIHEITMPGNIKKLALCADTCSDHNHSHEHIHFHCNSCNEIFCLEVDAFPQINLDGFSINQLEVQAKGVCKACQ